MTNEQLALAFDFLENTGSNIFLTGRAGTGKTTFLHNLKIQSPKRMVVVAPTGVAAINAKGTTIHSFFQLPFGLFLPGTIRSGKDVRKFSRTKIKIIRSMELLVIDEISMVRADLLDAIDDVLRRFRSRHLPFGGVQLLMIGDLQQLSPVVRAEEWELLSKHYNSPYFFDSIALRESSYRCIELNKIYRQSDKNFIDLLAKIRDNTLDNESLTLLNSRYIEGFNPDKKDGYITLTSHNHIAQSINDAKLQSLSGEAYKFKSTITGTFNESPVDSELTLKKGAQVMFARNDSSPLKRYVNGTIGEITDISSSSIEVTTAGDGSIIDVMPEKWENIRYTLNEETKEITEEVDGTFTQYPLKTAWAITIHKSQGLTFDRVIIDAARSFSHGQVYVALSRCRTLEGVVLCSPLRPTSIKSDPMVLYFSRDMEEHPVTDAQLTEDKRLYYRSLLFELIDFGSIFSTMGYLRRQLSDNLTTTYPHLIGLWNSKTDDCRVTIEDVSTRFKSQIERFMMNPNYLTDDKLDERLRKGAHYFMEQCTLTIEPLINSLDIDIDNKEVAKTIRDSGERLKEHFAIKMATLASVDGGFSVKEYLTAKAKATATETEKDKKAKKRSDGRSSIINRDRNTDNDINTDNITTNMASIIMGINAESGIDDELFEALRQWRRAKANEVERPAFTIAHQKVLIAIAQSKPRTYHDLLAIKGVGKIFVKSYGDEILDLINGYI